AVSAMDSLCPSCASPGLMISGCPPSAAMPAANDTRVRVEVLSKMTAAVCGPASGVRELGAALSSTARSRTLPSSAGPRSESLRKWRVMVILRKSGWGSAGDEAGQGVDERGELVGSDGQRRGEADASRCDGVDDEPGLERASGHGLRVRGLRIGLSGRTVSCGASTACQFKAEQQSLAGDLADPVDLCELCLE